MEYTTPSEGNLVPYMETTFMSESEVICVVGKLVGFNDPDSSVQARTGRENVWRTYNLTGVKGSDDYKDSKVEARVVIEEHALMVICEIVLSSKNTL